MNNSPLLFLCLLFCLAATSCENKTERPASDPAIQEIPLEAEKAAILATINDETKAAFSRDYQGWKSFWVQEEYVTKTYMEFPDSSISETLGWEAIDDFVRTYLEAHPEPDPIPTLVDEIDVRLYGDGAWVSFEQEDAVRGLKRETRLMEKIDGQWKIAGMHTTIYGMQRESK